MGLFWAVMKVRRLQQAEGSRLYPTSADGAQLPMAERFGGADPAKGQILRSLICGSPSLVWASEMPLKSTVAVTRCRKAENSSDLTTSTGSSNFTVTS